MAQVNVYGELGATGIDVAQGSSQSWTVTNVRYGQMLWFVAWPLHEVDLSGNNAYEVGDVSFETEANGNRTVNLTVTSTGSDPYGSYGLFIFWTSVPSS